MKKFLLLFTTLAIGALLMETGVRVLNLHEPLIWTPDARFGWKPIPGAKRLYTDEGYGLVEINTQGYRDKERAFRKDTGTIRIGVFGDSQTEAIQVHLDQTYHAKLQKLFVARQQNVEVLNFGVTGYSPAQVLLTLQQEVDRYDLDIIVVALFLDNDVSGSIPELSVSTTGTPFLISGTSQAGKPREFDYSQAEQSHEEFHREPKYTIRKHSGLYRFIFKIKNSFNTCGDHCQSSSIPTRYELYLEKHSDIWNEAWNTFDQTLLEIKALSEDRNKSLVLLSIPAGQTISKDAWTNIIQSQPAMMGAVWDLSGPENRLARFAQLHSIPLIQPYEQFLKVSPEKKLYFGNVGHLTVEGHEAIAREVFPQLQILVQNFLTSQQSLVKN